MDDIFIKNPLALFSLYTDYQAKYLVKNGKEIIRMMKEKNDFHVIYGSIWLWVLGAFEIIRTMKKYKHCFVEEKHIDLVNLKKELKKLRIPLAKLEKSNKKIITNEASVTSILKDDIGFTIKNETIYVKPLIKNFGKFINSFESKHVVNKLH